MPVRPLPENPNLEFVRYEAKDLMKARSARRPDAAQRIREFHPRFRRATDDEIFGAPFRLSDAQLTLAREHGFPSWPRLKARIEKPTLADRLDLPHNERITDANFRRAVDLMDAGNVEILWTHLRDHPDLVRQHAVFEGTNYFRYPTLVQFVAENPTRRGTLAGNIAEIAKAILELGAAQDQLDDTLALVASSDVANRCGVQVPLIDVLCEFGANPKSATRTGAMYGQHEALEALMQRGAKLDVAMAAALGRNEDLARLLPTSDTEDRHWAMALAAQLVNTDAMRMLLDAGEDPNRYNPLGGHSHSTPLHQAAGYGYLELVRLLVERGAKLDWRDTMWQATPVEWAKHEGRKEVEEFLSSVVG